jgi:chromosome segregation ATPase
LKFKGVFILDKRSQTNNLQGEIWTEDDPLLAETILRNVRQGKTVIEGCKEFEEMTEGRRTIAASKYRWFTKLVDQYRAGYELAKNVGREVKQKKKRKVNQGERYNQIMGEILDKDSSDQEPDVQIEDILLLVKKFKHQKNERNNETKEKDKEINKLNREIKELNSLNEDLKSELADTRELLELKTKDYNNVMEALKTLKNAGINITIPEPSRPKYNVDNNGLVTPV